MHVNDVIDFSLLSLQTAMETIGFIPEEISGILELLAAILNLGNAKFEGYSLPNGTYACKMHENSCKLKLSFPEILF